VSGHDDHLEWDLIEATLQRDNALWELENMHRSLSWRVTAPFRAIRAFVREAVQPVPFAEPFCREFTATRTDRLAPPRQ